MNFGWLKGMHPVEIDNHQQDLEVIRERCSEMNRNVKKSEDDENSTLVCTLTGHSNDVTSVDFAGRSLLATGSSDKTVRMYKWQVGDRFNEVGYSPLCGHRYGVNCITFSPFGTKLASASTDGVTIIWDVKTGDRLCGLAASSDTAVRVCAFSPNSAFLATGGDDDLAAVWDVSTLSLLRQVGGHDATVTSISFTPDSNYFTTGSNGKEIRLWDACYGHSLPLAIKHSAHDLGVSALHFSPTIGREDNHIIGKQYLLASGGQDTEVNLWSVEIKGQGGSATVTNIKESSSASITLYHRLCGHQAPVMAVKFSESGFVLASASGDKTVRLWDPIKLCPLAVLDGHKRYVTSCAFSDDGTLIATGSGDRSVRVWAVDKATQNCMNGTGVPVSKKGLHNFPLLRLRDSKKLNEWTSEDVCSWLGEHGLAEYAPNFRSNAIDGRELLATTDEILEHTLGVDAFGHRNKILRLIERFTQSNPRLTPSSNVTDSPPQEFLCPITQELIRDPVLCADGFTYERVAIEAWLASGKLTSPMTNETLTHLMLTPNRSLRTLIVKYKEENS